MAFSCRLLVLVLKLLHDVASGIGGDIRFSTQGGGSLPALAFGTAGIRDSKVISAAFAAGFRHIDTATLYGNHAAVRNAMRASGLPRNEIFLTTKVAFLPGGLPKAWQWFLDYVSGYGSGVSQLISKGHESHALQRNLQELGVSHLDLCLLHSPFASGMSEFLAAYLPHRLGRHKPAPWPWLRHLFGPSRWLLQRLVDVFGAERHAAAAARRRAWAALEHARNTGVCRYIGVSNYDASLLLELERSARVLPAVNQIELHPRFQARETLTYCQSRGVAVMAYGNRVSMHNPVAIQVAQRRGVEPAQVTLAWTLQRGAAAIVRSSRRDRMEQFVATLNMSLSVEESDALESLAEELPFFYDLRAVAKQDVAEKHERDDL